MAGKYGEPWEVSPLNGRIVDSGREFLSSWENRRACACVNALEGIANPQAIPAVIEAAKRVWAALQYGDNDSQAEIDFGKALAALEKTE